MTKTFGRRRALSFEPGFFYGTQVLNVLDEKEKKSRGKIFAFKIFSAIEDKLS